MAVRAEWDRLREVLIHRPGVEIDYAMLAPRPFLFERAYRTNVAIREHEKLERYLKEAGVRVRLLKTAVVELFAKSSEFRKTFTEKVLDTVKFDGDKSSSALEAKNFRKNLEVLDPETMFNILLLEPTVILSHQSANEPDYPSINSNLPLANLYFMRDQQVSSSNGIYIGRLKKKQRQKENSITEFILRALYGNDEDFDRIGPKGYFEGGDFIPSGDFAYIGIGNRSDIEGAMDFMKSQVANFREFVLVENPVYDFMEDMDPDTMVNMHLDTYFNLPGKDIAVTSPELANKAKCSLYYKNGSEIILSSKTTLSEFLKSKDIDILPLSIAEQMSYSSNFLTFRNNQILAVDSRSVLKRLMSEKVFPDKIQRILEHEIQKTGNEKLFPNSQSVKEYGIDYISANLSEITGGYGGAHCMTASVKRG